MYVKTVRNTSQILRIDCVNGAGTRKGLILHRFALSVGKRRTPARDGVCYNCRPKVPKEPYKPGVPWKEALEWVELEYVILQARYDGLSFQEIAELTELSAEECLISPSKRLIDADLGIT